MTARTPRGRLVTPDPRHGAVYRQLGGSTTHCELTDWRGRRYTCRSVDELNDDRRHRNTALDITACPQCVPVDPAPPGGLPDRMRALAAELAATAEAMEAR